ncbi:MAG: TetR/AcrR family transcriptional regulator [Propionibacteriaceae bacterium]|nr:TetR/AcrR family transcriptional regulator [Propionibacteriaceae bacterium]
MVRITKDPEVRRNELLDIALGLVQQVGYDAMSVESVTTAAGVAKGTFYHYFDSKEDLQFQLLERLGAELNRAIGAALATNPGNGAEQLQTFMDASAAHKMAHFGQFLPLIFLYRRENDSLRHRLHEVWAAATRDLLVSIVAAGIEEGSFSVRDADATADLLTTLWYEGTDRVWLRSLERPDSAGFADSLLRGISSVQQAQTRILGMPDGTADITITPAMTAGLEQAYHHVKELRQ